MSGLFHRKPDPVPVPPPVPTSGPALTWFRLHAGQTLLDFPLRTHPGATIWAATMWPDTRDLSGWGHRFWEPGPTGRGFVPALLDLGDVVQFAAQHPPHPTTYWFGYLHAIRPDSLLFNGPFPTPADAHAAAQLALVQQLHTTTTPFDAHHSTGIALPTDDPSTVATTLAQPPQTTSVTFEGPRAVVGDPAHGWLVVDTASLVAAMPYPPEHLTALLRERVPNLHGYETPLTLAALAAHHFPDGLPAPVGPTSGAPGPTGPGPSTPAPPAAPAAPAAAAATAPDGPGPAAPTTGSTAGTPDSSTPNTTTASTATPSPPDRLGPSLPDASL